MERDRRPILDEKGHRRKMGRAAPLRTAQDSRVIPSMAGRRCRLDRDAICQWMEYQRSGLSSAVHQGVSR